MAAGIRRRMLKDREKLVRMYHREGKSLTEIAEKYGCSRQYVQTVFVELGIRRRSRKQALSISPRRRRSRINFGDRHDNFIVRNFKRMTDRDLAKKLRKPVAAVTYRRLTILGKKKIERRNFTREEDEFIVENHGRFTDIDISRILGRSPLSVTHRRTRVLNCPKRRSRISIDPSGDFGIFDDVPRILVLN